MAAEGDYCEYIGELTCPILCDTEYDIKFQVTSHISGNIVFNVGGTSLGVTITGTGNYSFPLTTGTDCTDVIQIISGSANATFNIDNVSINYKNDVYDTLGISELACICTVDGCDSTITFSNDVDSFGYAYDEGEITNKLIVCGRLRNSVMQFNELVNNKDTFGNQSIIYANLDNTEEFITEWIPPYMAKALTVALSHSEVTINGTAYILRSTFTAQVSDDSEYVKVLATVQKADQTYTFLYRK
jgi:hypothetical protein